MRARGEQGPARSRKALSHNTFPFPLPSPVALPCLVLPRQDSRRGILPAYQRTPLALRRLEDVAVQKLLHGPVLLGTDEPGFTARFSLQLLAKRHGPVV